MLLSNFIDISQAKLRLQIICLHAHRGVLKWLVGTQSLSFFILIYHLQCQEKVRKRMNSLYIFTSSKSGGECFSFLLPPFLDAEYGACWQEEKKETKKIDAEGCCDKRMLEIGWNGGRRFAVATPIESNRKKMILWNTEVSVRAKKKKSL